jgi:hypothetical protein
LINFIYGGVWLTMAVVVVGAFAKAIVDQASRAMLVGLLQTHRIPNRSLSEHLLSSYYHYNTIDTAFTAGHHSPTHGDIILVNFC